MKIQIPRILGRLNLADYAPELGEQALTIWLNPPSGILKEYDACFARVYARNQRLLALPESSASKAEAREILEANEPDVDRMLELVSELLSAGPEETKVSKADLNQMLEDLADANPGFYIWMIGRIFRLIGEHRAAEKKS